MFQHTSQTGQKSFTYVFGQGQQFILTLPLRKPPKHPSADKGMVSHILAINFMASINSMTLYLCDSAGQG